MVVLPLESAARQAQQLVEGDELKQGQAAVTVLVCGGEGLLPASGQPEVAHGRENTSLQCSSSCLSSPLLPLTRGCEEEVYQSLVVLIGQRQIELKQQIWR